MRRDKYGLREAADDQGLRSFDFDPHPHGGQHDDAYRCAASALAFARRNGLEVRTARQVIRDESSNGQPTKIRLHFQFGPPFAPMFDQGRMPAALMACASCGCEYFTARCPTCHETCRLCGVRTEVTSASFDSVTDTTAVQTTDEETPHAQAQGPTPVLRPLGPDDDQGQGQGQAGQAGAPA